MRKMIKKIEYLAVLLLASFFMFSCTNSLIKVEEIQETKEAVAEKDENTISSIANEEWFKKGYYTIQNDYSHALSIVRGDGTIILREMDPRLESLEIIEDINEGEVNYLCKIYNGEKLISVKYGEYEDKEPSTRTVFYDKNGKEVGLEADSYGAYFSTKDKIFYNTGNNYNNKKNKRFDVNTKEITDIKYSEIRHLNGKIVFSTNPYDDKESGEIVVLDENLNEIKKIKGYSIDSIDNKDGFEFATVARLLKKGEKGDKTDRRYNFLDENFEMILDKDFEKRLYTSDIPIVTLVTDGIEYNYNLKTKEKVGEDKTYVEDNGQLTEWQLIQNEKEMYDAKARKLKNKEEYDYVDIFLHGNDVLFIARRITDTLVYDEAPCDIYNSELEKLAEVENVSEYYEKEGFLFVNNDTVYNSKWEEVVKFDEKCNISKLTKFGKTMFSDSLDMNYNLRKRFNIYDENFKLTYSNVYAEEDYAYDDYIIITDDEGTKFIDKDLNVVKKLDRKLDIKNWYTLTKHRMFVDVESGRMGILDGNFDIVVDNKKSVGDLQDKYFTYLNGFKYGLMDYTGKPILSFSIFDTMKEDAKEDDFSGDYVIEY